MLRISIQRPELTKLLSILRKIVKVSKFFCFHISEELAIFFGGAHFNKKIARHLGHGHGYRVETS